MYFQKKIIPTMGILSLIRYISTKYAKKENLTAEINK